MTRLVSAIYARGEQPRPTPTEREAKRRAAMAEVWHRTGLAVLDPEEVSDDWLRAALINECNKRHGRRGRK